MFKVAYNESYIYFFYYCVMIIFVQNHIYTNQINKHSTIIIQLIEHIILETITSGFYTHNTFNYFVQNRMYDITLFYFVNSINFFFS